MGRVLVWGSVSIHSTVASLLYLTFPSSSLACRQFASGTLHLCAPCVGHGSPQPRIGACEECGFPGSTPNLLGHTALHPPMAIAIFTSGALSQNLAPPHQEAGVDGAPKRYAQALTPSTREHVTLFGNRVSADVIKLRISR